MILILILRKEKIMKNINLDNIKKISDAYTTGWRKPLPEPKLNYNDTALLIIDMQYECASVEYGTYKRIKNIGNISVIDYVTERLKIVIPNIQSLQSVFRKKNAEIIYTVTCSMTKDGRDRSLGHKVSGVHCSPQSKEAEILKEVAPLENEIIFRKTTGSAFLSTTINYVLRNLGILNLIVVGCVTGGCVECSVRDARDLGYRVILIEDACFTHTKELQEISMIALNNVYCTVKKTNDIVKIFNLAGTPHL